MLYGVTEVERRLPVAVPAGGSVPGDGYPPMNEDTSRDGVCCAHWVIRWPWPPTGGAHDKVVRSSFRVYNGASSVGQAG